MKSPRRLGILLILIFLAISSCGAPAATEAPTETEPTSTPAPTLEPATATPSPVPLPSPSPTAEQLRLEVIQSQAWTDNAGQARVNVLFRNPYDFPVQPKARSRATLLSATGEVIRDREVYFLDGISGGYGFLLPGETVAANACFTCESLPLSEPWDSVEFLSLARDATSSWNYYTDVEASVGSVSFSGDSPLFDISGTVKNNSDSILSRISARILVFDQDGNLVGAAEASGYDVGPGATASFSGVGIGQAPEGPITYEVSALGVKY